MAQENKNRSILASLKKGFSLNFPQKGTIRSSKITKGNERNIGKFAVSLQDSYCVDLFNLAVKSLVDAGIIKKPVKNPRQLSRLLNEKQAEAITAYIQPRIAVKETYPDYAFAIIQLEKTRKGDTDLQKLPVEMTERIAELLNLKAEELYISKLASVQEDKSIMASTPRYDDPEDDNDSNEDDDDDEDFGNEDEPATDTADKPATDTADEADEADSKVLNDVAADGNGEDVPF
ncbi:MAG TPA: hypothetical protein PKD00_01955 [Burkholderiales bacterium]|nr:hypothetical protein [Burkholderiales bacterium]